MLPGNFLSEKQRKRSSYFIDLLTPDFAKSIIELLAHCESAGVLMLPYSTIRTPIEQAVLWKKGRGEQEITSKIAEMETRGAYFLAEVLRNAEHESGEVVTHALPGYSWHQWGEAIDCHWILNRKRIFDLDTLHQEINGYQFYSAAARQMGLTSGLYWQKLVDAFHVQMRPNGSPEELYSISEIDTKMKDLYS